MTTTTTERPSSHYDIVEIASSDGSQLGHVQLELSDENLIAVTMTDEEDNGVTLVLDIAEAEALIAKLAVKVAQARMAQTA